MGRLNCLGHLKGQLDHPIGLEPTGQHFPFTFHMLLTEFLFPTFLSLLTSALFQVEALSELKPHLSYNSITNKYKEH